ncbi:MAG: hypothetical protein ABR947_09675 [Solirubrobacteraceae bacterium]
MSTATTGAVSRRSAKVGQGWLSIVTADRRFVEYGVDALDALS